MAAGVAGLDVVNNQGAVAPSSEQVVVVEGDAHALNALTVSLHFAQLLESALPDLDAAGPVVLAHACEEVFAGRKVSDLRNHDFGVTRSLGVGVRRAPNVFVVADDERVVLLARDVAEACELDAFLGEVLLTVSVCSLFEQLQVVEETESVHAATGEAHVVLVPVNASDFSIVALRDHVVRALLRVEVVNVNSTKVDGGSEHVTTVGESNFSAALELELRRVLLEGA